MKQNEFLHSLDNLFHYQPPKKESKNLNIGVAIWVTYIVVQTASIGLTISHIQSIGNKVTDNRNLARATVKNFNKQLEKSNYRGAIGNLKFLVSQNTLSADARVQDLAQNIVHDAKLPLNFRQEVLRIALSLDKPHMSPEVSTRMNISNLCPTIDFVCKLTLKEAETTLNRDITQTMNYITTTQNALRQQQEIILPIN